MTEIDRRALFGAVGAGLLIASCGKGQPEEEATFQKKRDRDPPCDGGRDDEGVGAGGCTTWGDPVHYETPPYPQGIQFAPKYICAAYIKFDPTGLIIRHGYVLRTNASEDSSRIIKLLTVLKDPTVTNPPIQALYVRDNFSEFSMKMYHHIVALFIDNDPSDARFLTLADIRNDPDHKSDPDDERDRLHDEIVRFARFSGIDRREVQKNKAYYNMQPINIQSGFDGKVAYRLDYYNYDENRHKWEDIATIVQGAAGRDTHRLYSMNIHFLMRVGSQGSGIMIPMVLDPDTGNMGSNP